MPREIACFAAMLEKFTIAPFFCWTIAFTKTIVGSSVPFRFRSSTFSYWSNLRSKMVWSGFTIAPAMLPPAPFTSASTRPCSAMTFSYTDSIMSRSSTLHA